MMKGLNLTSEQHQVIHHPIGNHARVLAVAGSGKSTTLAYRIKHLIMDKGVPASSIRVLMFNALARQQFNKHLMRVGLPDELHPEVHTFHSFSYKVIQGMTRNGVLPELIQFWIGDKEEMNWLTANRAVNNLEKQKLIPHGYSDPDEVITAIGLWKGAMLPPTRAGSNSSRYLPLLYEEYERLRLEKAALTFDDFIPLTVDLLDCNPAAFRKWCQGVRHVIVDEYQDINYGQQRLIELLASDNADVVVVGDDDQTIYEWRGARPDFIIQDFPEVFDDKPVQDYCLSRSFRFGPVIAQSAANLINQNTQRVEKPLVAHDINKHGFIHVFNGGFDATKELTEQVIALRDVDRVPPANIIVLARLFAQLDSLESEFLAKEIPFRVDGQNPFFERIEVKVLLDYIRLGRDYHKPMTREIGKSLLFVANKPFRKLSRNLLYRLTKKAGQSQLSTHEVLEKAACGKCDDLNHFQRNRITGLWQFFNQLSNKISMPEIYAGELLKWIVSEVDYLSHFQDYYGKGEHADEKKQAVLNFLEYVTYTRVTVERLLDLIGNLDTTQGAPEDEQITFTTIFRTKGLEYDYVIIPQCNENALPYLKGQRTTIHDKQGKYQESKLTDQLEGERRLFYVALTRARKGVLIGTSGEPSRFLTEMQSPVPA